MPLYCLPDTSCAVQQLYMLNILSVHQQRFVVLDHYLYFEKTQNIVFDLFECHIYTVELKIIREFFNKIVYQSIYRSAMDQYVTDYRDVGDLVK